MRALAFIALLALAAALTDPTEKLDGVLDLGERGKGGGDGIDAHHRAKGPPSLPPLAPPPTRPPPPPL